MFNPTEYKEAAGTTKTLDPGQLFARIADMKLDQPSWVKGDGYFVQLTLEGPDLGDEFEGFEIDKNDPGLGRYRGKIANVRNGAFAISTFTFKEKLIERDQQIFQYLGDLTKQMGKQEQLNEVYAARLAADQSFSLDTIEEYFDFVKSVLVDPENWGQFAVLGEPYVNKNGGTSYSLMFPKKENGKYAWAQAKSADEQPATLLVPATYILPVRKPKAGEAAAGDAAPAAAPVDGFGGQPAIPAAGAPAAGGSDPELDQLPF